MSRLTAAAPLPDRGVRADRVVRTNGVDLAVETFGDPGDPAVLLVAGAATSMAGWPDELCALISAGRRFVVRYDHRDTGRSVTYPAGVPPYTLRDLVADAVGLLDVLDVRRAHLVGVSMGGMIVQLAALDHAERVESMTLLSTSPGGPGPDRPGGPELPPTPLSVRVEIDDVTWPDWSDRGSVIEHLVALARPRAGRARPFDEAGHRELARRAVDRTADLLPSMLHHAALDHGEPWRHRLGRVRARTLVVHGAEDPIYPAAHGRALASEIPGARLLVLRDAGHDLERADWDLVVPALLRHTAPAAVTGGTA